MKLCGTCKIEKDDLDFSTTEFKRSNGKCRACVHIYNQEYYRINQEKIKENTKNWNKNNKDKRQEYLLRTKEIRANKRKVYNEKNKEKISSRYKIYYQENIEYMSERGKEYRKDPQNKEKLKTANKIYNQKNKDKINKSRNKRKINRRKSDPEYKLRNNISTSINKALKRNNSYKRGSIIKYLSYTIKELKQHIEQQFEVWMTWKNQGSYDPDTWDDNNVETWTWQLDHIIPQSDLPYTSMEEENFKKCWALENLRPLSAKQNLLDGISRARHDKNK